MSTIRVIVAELPSRHGLFSAQLEDGTVVCKSSRQPLLDSARELIARGVDPKFILVMRHRGDSFDAMSATIGKAAQLTVEERSGSGSPRFQKWRPFSTPEDDD